MNNNNNNEGVDIVQSGNPPKVYRRDLNKMRPSIPASNIARDTSYVNIKKLFDFVGTAGVLEYLAYSFVYFALLIIPAFIFVLLGMDIQIAVKKWSMLVNLVMFLPMLAVTVRRLHDTGKSGLFVLISFIPIAGGIILLIMMLLPGDYSINNPYRESKL